MIFIVKKRWNSKTQPNKKQMKPYGDFPYVLSTSQSATRCRNDVVSFLPCLIAFGKSIYAYAYTCVHSSSFSSICFGGGVVGEKILCSVKHTQVVYLQR